MPGGWQTFRCDRCPLVIELGGFTALDERGAVTADTAQLACGACGTLHRLTEEGGVCRVTALPGPVRASRPVTLRDVSGEEFPSEEWFAEADWRPVGEHPGGIAAAGRLACSHCGVVGRVGSLADFLYPEGHGKPRRQECPVCRGPMECVGVADAI